MRRTMLLAALFLAVYTPMAAAQGAAQTAPYAIEGVLEGTLTFVPYGQALFEVNTLGVASGVVKGLGLTNLFTFHQPTDVGTVVNGRFFFIAANGDKISGTYDGTTEWPEPELMIGRASWVITGGTGRFANATGTIDMTVEITVLGFETYEWPAVWKVEGTIQH